MKVLIHITIVDDNGEVFTQEFKGENCSSEQERGIEKEYDIHGNLKKLGPNGHQRTLIKLWSGCPDWDSFRK